MMTTAKGEPSSPSEAPYHPAQKSWAAWAALLLIAALLNGCGLFGTSQPKRIAGRGKPYTVMGQTYHPLLSGDNFSEEGIASWYGKDFHGKLTANGERYDMYGMTAAHKLLPFNTKVKVTNLRNGSSVVVRINDRGPFVADRVIDLTNTAAARIGMIGSGTTRVRVESIGGVAAIQNGNIIGNFYVQVGAFAQRNNADRLVSKFNSQGMRARNYFAPTINLWRTQVGPYGSFNEATSAAQGLKASYPGNFVVAE